MSLWMQQHEAVAARREMFVQMVDAVDLFSPKSGLMPQVEMVKAGQDQYAIIAGSVLEVGYGTYRIRLAAADLDVAGAAMLRVTADGAVAQYIPLQVVLFPGEVHLVKAALVNQRRHTIATGEDEIYDDDAGTVLRRLVPNEADGVITIQPA